MSENERTRMEAEKKASHTDETEVEGHGFNVEPTERRPLGVNDDEPEVEGHSMLRAGNPERKTWDVDSKRA